MSKYVALKNHLMGLDVSHWRASFKEIEQVLGCPLPTSARRYQAWWANNENKGRHCEAWLAADWFTSDLDLAGEKVTFSRQSKGRDKKLPEGIKVLGRPPRKVKKIQETHATTMLPEQNFSLAYNWHKIGFLSTEGDKLIFPKVPPKPGLYQFILKGAGRRRNYIGETSNISRRLHNYRSPGPSQVTNLRLNRILTDHLLHGGNVEVQIIVDNPKIARSEMATEAPLSQKVVRRLLENAAILAQGATDIDSLNL